MTPSFKHSASERWNSPALGAVMMKGVPIVPWLWYQNHYLQLEKKKTCSNLKASHPAKVYEVLGPGYGNASGNILKRIQMMKYILH